MNHKTLLLSLVTLTASCVSEEPLDTSTPPSEQPETADAIDGDDGEGVPLQPTMMPERDPSFTESSPCGDQTVDVLTVAPNHTVAFCESPDGSTMYIETAPLGHPAVVPEDVTCAAQLYAQLAPTNNVPKRLALQCRAEDLRQSVRPIDLGHLPQDGLVDNDVYSHYCAGNGATEFQEERCYSGSTGSYTSLCRSNSVSWHQRTCKSTVGDWCRQANQVIASCSGATRFLGTERKRGRSSWGTFYDYDIQSGYWSSDGIVAAKKAILFGWKDWDFQMKGDSYGNAYHRYSVRFWRN